jgi:hypothetical protein
MNKFSISNSMSGYLTCGSPGRGVALGVGAPLVPKRCQIETFPSPFSRFTGAEEVEVVLFMIGETTGEGVLDGEIKREGDTETEVGGEADSGLASSVNVDDDDEDDTGEVGMGIGVCIGVEGGVGVAVGRVGERGEDGVVVVAGGVDDDVEEEEEEEEEEEGGGVELTEVVGAVVGELIPSDFSAVQPSSLMFTAEAWLERRS